MLPPAESQQTFGSALRRLAAQHRPLLRRCPRRIAVDAMARYLFAGGEPHAGQGLHPANQPVQHRDAQRAAGLERVHPDVEIPADVVLLAERRPPDIADSLRISDALRRRIGAGSLRPAPTTRTTVSSGRSRRRPTLRPTSRPPDGLADRDHVHPWDDKRHLRARQLMQVCR